MNHGMLRFIAPLLLTLLSLKAQAVEEVIYYHNDALGSPIAATDQEGRVVWRKSYAPYGQPIDPAAPNELGYTGKFQEPGLGIQDFGARWYDPRIGRFLAIDPLGFDPQNPQSFNRYAYANNNPYGFVDPDGNSPLDAGFFIADTVSLGLAVASGNPAAIQSAAFDFAASAVGLASPIPGAGPAIKAARAGDKATDLASNGRVVIGENMDRVQRFADKLGADTFRGEGMEANMRWIREQKTAEKEVIDIGPDFSRREKRVSQGTRPDSPFYNMERKETGGYEGYKKGFERHGKHEGAVPGFDE